MGDQNQRGALLCIHGKEQVDDGGAGGRTRRGPSIPYLSGIRPAGVTALEEIKGRVEADARQQTIDATRRFARRQQRWFRRDSRIDWLPYDSPSLAEDALRLWASSTQT